MGFRDTLRLILTTPELVVFTLGVVILVSGLVAGGAGRPSTAYSLFVTGAVVAAISVLRLRRKGR